MPDQGGGLAVTPRGIAATWVSVPPVPRPAARAWDPVLICLAGFILTSVGRVHQLFPALAVFKPALVTGALAILLLLLDRSAARRFGGLRTTATRWLLALAMWMALSVPGALWAGGALHTWIGFGKTVVIFVVMVGAVRTVRDVERLASVYFYSAVIFSLVVLVRFDLGEAGRLARLYYYDANDFATLAVTALPLGLYSALAARTLFPRLMAWGGIAALAVGFVWSGSRGGFVALLIVIAYVLLRHTTIAKRWRLATVVVIGVVAAATATDAYWTSIRTLLRPREDYNLTSEEGRLQIWRRGLGYMRQHPLLGVGAGNFGTAEGTISPLAERQERGRGVKWTAPHNSYIQVGAELGVPGLIIFLGFLSRVFAALRWTPPPGGESGQQRATRLAHSLTASLLGFTVGAFFLTLAYHEILYMLAAIAVALRRVAAPYHAFAMPPAVSVTAAPWDQLGCRSKT